MFAIELVLLRGNRKLKPGACSYLETSGLSCLAIIYKAIRSFYIHTLAILDVNILGALPISNHLA
jgi:hypothetical protein